MKRFAKILVLCLSVCLLVGALALIVSANTGTDGTQKTFEGVTGLFVTTDANGDYVGFAKENFKDAVAAAEGRTIYLNGDWSVAQDAAAGTVKLYTYAYAESDAPVGIKDPGKLVLDLNGYTVTESLTGPLFALTDSEQSVTIKGSGTFANIVNLVTASNGAEFVIDTTGEITIIKTTHAWTPFAIAPGTNATLKFTGAVTVNAPNQNRNIFLVCAAEETDNRRELNKIVFDSAKFIVSAPGTDPAEATDTLGIFFNLRDGVDIEIKNKSHLEIDYGKMFTVGNTTKKDTVVLGNYIGNDMEPDLDYIDAKPSLGLENLKESQKIYVTAADSDIICTNNYRKLTGQGWTTGSLYVDNNKNAAFLASFTDCNIGYAGTLVYMTDDNNWRTLSNNGKTGNFIGACHQIVIDGCTVTNVEKRDYVDTTILSGLTNSNANLVIKNSTVDLGIKEAVTRYSLMHNEVKDGFVGVLLEEVKILSDIEIKMPSAVTPNAEGIVASYPWSTYRCIGTIHTNVSVLEAEGPVLEQELTAYKAVITSKALVPYASIILAQGDGTADYSWDGTAATGAWSWSKALGAVNRAGMKLTEAKDGDGNEYIKFEFTKDYTSTDYVSDMLTGSSFRNDVNLGNSKYIIQSFDVATSGQDSWINGASITFAPFLRFYRPITTATGSLDEGTREYSYDRYTYGSVSSLAPVQITVSSAGALSDNATFVDTAGITLPANGVWSRLTFVYEMELKNNGAIVNVPLPIFTNASTSFKDTENTLGGGKNVTYYGVYAGTEAVPCVEIALYVHVYLDGQLLGSSGDIVASNKAGYGTEENNLGTRISFDSNKKDTKTYMGSYFPVSQLNCLFVDHIRFQSITAGAVGTVMYDNYHYTAYNHENLAGVDIGLRDEHGNVTASIVDNKYLNPLASNKNSTIEKLYKQAPAVGSVDGVEYRSETELNAAIKEGSLVELYGDLATPIAAKVNFTVIRNGYSAEFTSNTHKVISYANIGAYRASVAAADEMKKVDFIYSDEKTESVNVPLGTKLMGAAVPERKSEKQTWSKTVYEWDSAAIEAVNAAANVGVFTVEAVNPTDVAWVDVKSSLTLYGFYYLNLYVPKASGNVTDVTISTDAAGSVSLKYIDTEFEGTVNSAQYNKYVMTIGLTDTSIIEFFVNYKVDGVQKTYSFKYGIPYYAYNIMKNGEKYSDLEKTLVMDMVNYNDKVIEKLGLDETAEGAQIYDLMLQNSNYKKFVSVNKKEYADESFIDGDIYTGEISKIPARTDTLAGTDISIAEDYTIFYDKYGPRFVMKISDEAADYADVASGGNWVNANTVGIAVWYRNPRGATPSVSEITSKNEDIKGNLTTAATLCGLKTDTEKYDYYSHFIHSVYYNDYLYDIEKYTNGSYISGSNISVMITDFVTSQSFDFYLGHGAGTSTSTAKVGSFHFSVAGYVNKLLAEQAEANDKGNTAMAESLDVEIELAKALYAFAKSAKAFAK